MNLSWVRVDGGSAGELMLSFWSGPSDVNDDFEPHTRFVRVVDGLVSDTPTTFTNVIGLRLSETIEGDFPIRDALLVNDRMIFASDRDGDYEIYNSNPDHTEIRQLTHNDVFDFSPVYIR